MPKNNQPFIQFPLPTLGDVDQLVNQIGLTTPTGIVREIQSLKNRQEETDKRVEYLEEKINKLKNELEKVKATKEKIREKKEKRNKGNSTYDDTAPITDFLKPERPL